MLERILAKEESRSYFLVRISSLVSTVDAQASFLFFIKLALRVIFVKRGMHRKACLSFATPTGTTNGFSCSAGLAKPLVEKLRTLTI